MEPIPENGRPALLEGSGVKPGTSRRFVDSALSQTSDVYEVVPQPPWRNSNSASRRGSYPEGGTGWQNPSQFMEGLNMNVDAVSPTEDEGIWQTLTFFRHPFPHTYQTLKNAKCFVWLSMVTEQGFPAADDVFKIVQDCVCEAAGFLLEKGEGRKRCFLS